MRRPSWNKSQAIQQVISLKSLLEPSPPNNYSNSASLKSAVLRPPQIPSNHTVSFLLLSYSFHFLGFFTQLYISVCKQIYRGIQIHRN